MAVGCIILVVIFIALGAGAYVVLRLSSVMNITQTVELAGCRLISGVIGPEDFEYLPQEQGLVVSSLDRIRALVGATGGLYWIDLTKPPEKQVANRIQTNYPDHFKPHGLTFQPTEDGGKLFVISHAKMGEWPHTIEVFSLTSSSGTRQWKHVQTLTDEALVSPNDLVALPDGSLFIANDKGLGGVPGLIVDVLLRRERAPLVYYDGSKFVDLGANVIMSAGITAVKEGGSEFLYRSDYINKAVQKLKIHRDQPGDPSVEVIKTIPLNSRPDNFSVDEEGVVYVTAQFSIVRSLANAVDRNIPAPTQIFKIQPNDVATLIYANKGEQISTGSVGAVVKSSLYGSRLYVGQIFNDGILTCPMDK